MPSPLHIRISLADQSLLLCEGRELLHRYTISSSRHGHGTEEGSYKTPLGSFRICEKFGDLEPLHTIFRSRLPVGVWDPSAPCSEDLVLTRILRLDGLDPDNLNTYQRYIYIHGTNHEDHLGSPASQGCIRLSNQDMLDLYERTPLDTPVRISLHAP